MQERELLGNRVLDRLQFSPLISIAAVSGHCLGGGCKRYSAVLWIHGGPEGQDTLNFDPWAVYLAQNGYVVLEPHYRGSSGYREKFPNLNVEDSGGGEVDDVTAASSMPGKSSWRS